MPHDPLRELVGSQLSAVCFIQDYVQFQFDGPAFTVLTPVALERGGVRTGSDEVEYRNRVCEQIGKVVHDARLRIDEGVFVSFIDGSRLVFSLSPSDYPGPEAVHFHDASGNLYVF